jgi:hypothetical protein
MSNEARKSEAHDEKATVEFRGHTFEVSREYDEWPLEFLEALEDGKSISIVRGALGPAQWAKVRAMNLKVGDVRELADDIAVAMGFASAGESSASSD